MQTPYYKNLKKQVRALVRKGMSKVEAARTLHINGQNAYQWTRDIKLGKGYKRVGGLALTLLTELISKGYVFSESPEDVIGLRLLRRYFPVKTAIYHRLRIFYLEGNERKAMEAFLKKTNLRAINYSRLGLIRQAFGIKRYEREFNKRKVLE